MRELIPMNSGSGLPLAESAMGGGLIFTSGQLPRRVDGSVPESFADQVTLVLNNLKSALDRAGSGLEGILKVNVYLASLDDFHQYNEIYKTFMAHAGYPARTSVEVCRFRGESRLEIDAIAVPLKGQ